MSINNLSSKEIIKLNKSQWEKVRIHDMHVDTNIIKCQKRLFNDSQGKKLLYIGFGEGQNLMYFIKEGFDCYGTEIAKSRIDYFRRQLKKAGKKAVLKLVDSNKLPFKDNFFDVVIAWESICYNNEKGLKQILDEILRVMKPGGHFLSSIPSGLKHSLCAEEVSPSVYRPAKTDDQTQCVIYGFKNRKQIKKIYEKFNKAQIGFYSSKLFKPGEAFHYVIYCRK